jgi:hypothetical protein
MFELQPFLEIITSFWEIILLFFIISIAYASVGFGGGSSYLAILTITPLAFTEIRAIALICNIVVVLGGTYIYMKNNLFDWRKTLPLAITSIPLAFIGGYLKISQTFFYILLGITLFTAAFLMWFNKYNTSKYHNTTSKKTTIKNVSFGGFIGFVSGMVGIGGGIFLSPLLHLTNWDNPKKIAATSSFFILINSIAGLIGQSLNPNFSIEPTITLILMAVVLIGGQIGTRLSVQLISPIQLKKATAILIFLVSIRILWKYTLL